ncbi:DUF4328 domain-containing protein [Thioalkalivibrio sp. ALM2T]|uniref:DUF4328 domain-containing protein n=1 Tax=Thioalkalivibrio sp. ALM2T TaxID=1158184 RepID=UPI0003A76E8F|nr:DUF4328 domain-containing protein [Thioalkalivibrio sp. ALM2T]
MDEVNEPHIANVTVARNWFSASLWIYGFLVGFGLLSWIRERGLVVDYLAAESGTQRAVLASRIEDNAVLIPVLLYTVPLLLPFAMFLVWKYLMSRVVSESYNSHARFDPTLSVVWYFVPILNIWKPYQALKEKILILGFNSTGGLKLWWFLWLLSFALSFIASGILLWGEGLGQYLSAINWAVVSSVVSLTMIAVWWGLVTEITNTVESLNGEQVEKSNDGLDELIEWAHSIDSERVKLANETGAGDLQVIAQEEFVDRNAPSGFERQEAPGEERKNPTTEDLQAFKWVNSFVQESEGVLTEPKIELRRGESGNDDSFVSVAVCAPNGFMQRFEARVPDLMQEKEDAHDLLDGLRRSG